MFKIKNDFINRLLVLCLIFGLLILAKLCMNIGRGEPSYHMQIYDIGHHYIPSLLQLFGRDKAEWIWWAGSMSIEVMFAAVVLTVMFKGAAYRLGIGLALVALFHSLFWHVTILPIPNDIVWKFPIPTGQIPMPDDFWFSGHVTYAVLFAISCIRQKIWVQVLCWLYVVFICWLVLATRTHYSIDVIGSFFIAYTIYRLLRTKLAAFTFSYVRKGQSFTNSSWATDKRRHHLSLGR